jgi:hypothetical protein
MSAMTTDPVRPADDDARALARPLLADARFGALATLEPGSGHPMASRVAVALDADSDAGRRARERWLAVHPKAALCVDFGDFAFRRIECTGASLNGGFGRAWRLQPADLDPDPDPGVSGSPAA